AAAGPEPVPPEEPTPLEPAADAPTSAVAAEPPIELAQLESTSASEPLPTGEAHAVESLAAETAEVGAVPVTSETEAGAAPETGANITEVNGHIADSEEEVGRSEERR